MNCTSCAAKIPEGAKFCPECGSPVSRAPAKQKSRPRPSHSARPLADNPYQPQRAALPAEDLEEALDIDDDIEESVAPVRPNPKPKPRPKAPEDIPSLLTSKKTIAPAPPKNRAAADTMVPKRVQADDDKELDAFFVNDQEDELDDEYSSDEEQGFFERNMRAVITVGLLLIMLLIGVIWLNASNSGRVFRAGLGITGDAYAYKLLGDRSWNDEQYAAAGNAYYQALKYDPDNYDYAMLSAKAFYKIGDKELAAKAAQLAITLKGDDKEAYKLLDEMFPANARPANIAKILDAAAEKFGDESLKE